MMELTIDQAVLKALEEHKSGNLLEAERIYRAILLSQPSQPDANHNLGLIAISVNQIRAALPLFKIALDVNPKIEQFWLSYIDALIKDRQFEKAQRFFKQGRAEKKLLGVVAHFLIAEINTNLGKLEEAAEIYIEITKLQPDNAQAHNKLGVIFHDLGKLDAAIDSYKQAIALHPEYSEAQFNLGNTLSRLGKLIDAEVSFKHAVESEIGFFEAYENLSATQRKLGKIEKAEESDRYTKFLKTPILDAVEMKKFSNLTPFRRPNSIEYPALYRPGMGTENVGGFLRAMAQMLRPNRILEIGAGYTTPFLLEALINNERVYDDGNLDPMYFKDHDYDPKLVVIDNMSLGELSERPGMGEIISSSYTEFIEGNFENMSDELVGKFGEFDFVWFDCGGIAEYKTFMNKYWNICSDYIFFHYTYSDGSPNELHEIILNNATGDLSIFDIVEPHKSRQGSITIVKKMNSSKN